MDTTPEERAVTLEEAEALFIEEMPLAPIFHFNNAYLVQKSVKNFAISPIGVIYFTHLEKQ